MSSLAIGPLLTAAAVGGLATQLTLSPINEVDTIKFLGFVTASNALLLGYVAKTTLKEAGITGVLFRFLLVNVVFFSVLTVATIVRRLFFHPLRRFPGKTIQAVTSLHMVQVQKTGHRAFIEREAHRKLGDIVRTAPNELSINNVRARIDNALARVLTGF